MDGWIRDLKYAVRSMAKLASSRRCDRHARARHWRNTAVFGVLNAVVLEPLPYPAPDQLVRIYQLTGAEDNFLPGPALVALRERSQTVDVAAIYTYRAEGVDLTDHAQPERVQTLPVSADYFRVLRGNPVVGQVFERGDERANAKLAVISERIWREQYLGAAPDACRPNAVDERRPASRGRCSSRQLRRSAPPGIDIWTPIDLRDTRQTILGQQLCQRDRTAPRRNDDASGAGRAATIAGGLQWNTAKSTVRRSARVAPLQATRSAAQGPMLWILLGAVGLLLVIACVNVASLFLARGAAREAELAVRAALGCSRWRLVRQLLIESCCLVRRRNSRDLQGAGGYAGAARGRA